MNRAASEPLSTFERVTGRGNGDERRRRWILFLAGLVGMFVYLAVSTATGSFQLEWLLAFLTMMGVSGIGGIGK